MSLTVAELRAVFTTDTKPLDRGLKSAEQGAQKAGRALTTGLTLPIVAMGAAAFIAAKDFNRGMADVASLIPGNTKRVAEFKAAVLAMSDQFGASTDDLTRGLYQTISAFGDTADSVKILETNVRAAKAGLATTSEAIALTSSLTKGYGDTSKEAVAKAADLALLTVRLGQTTFPELAASIGKVVPLTKAMGVSQEELFATMATLTGVTGNAAEVTTQLRGVMQGLMAPTADAAKAMKDAGFASGEALVKQKGLAGAIGFLVDAAKKSGQPLQSFISSIEGQTLALALTGSQADTYKGKLKEMGAAAGTTDEAFREQTEGVNKAGHEWDLASNRAKNMAIRLGDGLAPALLDATDAAKPMIDKMVALAQKFADADPEMQKLIVKIALGAAALGPFLFILGKVIGAVAATTRALHLASAAHGIHTLAVKVSRSTLGTWLGVKALELVAWLRSTAATIGHTVVLGAHRAVMLLVTGATKVWTAAQWLLNRALFANPIGLVVLALAALVGGLIIAYRNSETFRRIVDAAFRGVAAAGRFMWERVLKPTFAFLVRAWFAVAGAIIHGAASAFGWVPGVGPKLRAAAREFDKFRDRANAALGGVKDQSAQVSVSLSDAAKAAAGYWGGRITPSRAKALLIKSAARGNLFEEHTPQIAPGGAMRVWAEPETGGEAYIPLARDGRRPRAEKILATVADRFGMRVDRYAGGGITLATRMPSTQSLSMIAAAVSAGAGMFARDIARGAGTRMKADIASNLLAAAGPLGGLFGGGGSAGGSGGVGVSRWAAVAARALAYTGMPASWLPSLLRRMNQESGGNPFAINNWDSNARRGDPSRGLMQTIGSTFRAYARELVGRGIYDPFANIVASIRYANRAYGAAPFGWNRAGGYDDGGWLNPGVTLAANLTGSPERVRTQAQEEALWARMFELAKGRDTPTVPTVGTLTLQTTDKPTYAAVRDAFRDLEVLYG